ncbi:MAG TPA: hypothetical protein VNM48_01235 [Chloroflexota bacterium]|nr:hypothetical protein [Chloroflexota bacterium]
MDDDAERGVIFILGLIFGLGAMWLIFTSRGRKTAQHVFEAAGDLAEDLADTAGDAMEEVTVTAGKARKRFPF